MKKATYQGDPNFLEEYSKILLTSMVNEGMAEYVVVNQIRKLEYFKTKDLMELVSASLSKLGNKTLKEKVFSELPHINDYIDFNYDYDTLEKKLFYRKTVSLFITFYSCNEMAFDEDGLINVFPEELKIYIKSLYSLFQQKMIKKEMPERKLPAHIDSDVCYKTASIINKVITNCWPQGKNIVRIFRGHWIYIYFKLPKSFLALCEVRGRKIFLRNTDIQSEAFKSAVLDLIRLTFY